MFKHSVLSASLLALSSSVVGKPIARRGGISLGDITPIISIDGQSFDVSAVSVKEFSRTHSFDSFGGLASLSGFDQFFGEGNFCSASTVQVFSKEEIVTCQSVDITVIQQQLSIVAEYVKRVVLTQSCETETQVIAFSQWLAGMVSFGEDLRRVSERHVSFDSSIASHISSVVDAHGNINVGDFGFSGSEIGSHSVTIIGGNWNDQTSPASVGLAWDSCVAAAGSIPLGVSCEVCSSSSSTVSLPPVISSGGCSGSDCGSSISLPPPVISSCPPGIDCTLPPVESSGGCSGADCGTVSLPPPVISSCPPGIDCTLPPVESSGGCSGADCGTVSLPPVSGCPSGDCGVSSGCPSGECGSMPPVVSSGCSGSDCGAGTVSLPPVSGCPSGDCGSMPSGCSGMDCGVGTVSLPPVSGCPSGDCGSGEASVPPVVSGCPSGECSNAPALPPVDASVPPEGTPAATLPGAPVETLPGTPLATLPGAPLETVPGAPLETIPGTPLATGAPAEATVAAAPTDAISVALADPSATAAASDASAATPLPTLPTIPAGASSVVAAAPARRRGIFSGKRRLSA